MAGCAGALHYVPEDADGHLLEELVIPCTLDPDRHVRSRGGTFVYHEGAGMVWAEPLQDYREREGREPADTAAPASFRSHNEEERGTHGPGQYA